MATFEGVLEYRGKEGPWFVKDKTGEADISKSLDTWFELMNGRAVAVSSHTPRSYGLTVDNEAPLAVEYDKAHRIARLRSCKPGVCGTRIVTALLRDTLEKLNGTLVKVEIDPRSKTPYFMVQAHPHAA